MSHDATSHDCWIVSLDVSVAHVTHTHTTQMAAQVIIHRHDRPVIGPVGACINFGCMMLLSRNFRLESAERPEKIPSRAVNARLSGSQLYMYRPRLTEIV